MGLRTKVRSAVRTAYLMLGGIISYLCIAFIVMAAGGLLGIGPYIVYGYGRSIDTVGPGAMGAAGPVKLIIFQILHKFDKVLSA